MGLGVELSSSRDIHRSHAEGKNRRLDDRKRDIHTRGKRRGASGFG